MLSQILIYLVSFSVLYRKRKYLKPFETRLYYSLEGKFYYKESDVCV